MTMVSKKSKKNKAVEERQNAATSEVEGYFK